MITNEASKVLSDTEKQCIASCDSFLSKYGYHMVYDFEDDAFDIIPIGGTISKSVYRQKYASVLHHEIRKLPDIIARA